MQNVLKNYFLVLSLIATFLPLTATKLTLQEKIACIQARELEFCEKLASGELNESKEHVSRREELFVLLTEVLAGTEAKPGLLYSCKQGLIKDINSFLKSYHESQDQKFQELRGMLEQARELEYYDQNKKEPHIHAWLSVAKKLYLLLIKRPTP